MRSGLVAAVALLLAFAGCITVEIGPDTGSDPDAGGDAPHATKSPPAKQSAGGGGSASATGKPSPKPAPKDTDKDGASDKAEVENGTDPKDAGDVPYVLPPTPAVDAGALLADLGPFATSFNERKGNGPGHLASRDWLADRFGSYGLDVWRQPFSTGGLDQENVVGIRWGLDPDAWVVVGAHYDTTTNALVDGSASQGAYDDGSGTLMVVHLAGAYANLTLPYTLVFVAFDGEERGLEGSQAFLSSVITGDTPYPSAEVVAMVDIDMFGLNWPGTGTPMVFITNSQPIQAAVEAERLAQGVPNEGISYAQGIVLGSSDFGTFFDEGIPTGFFISDFDQLGAPMGLQAGSPLGVYPFWHHADTMETMTLMAGDAAHLEMGFQSGLQLAAGLVHFLGSTPGPLPAGTDSV